MVTGSVGTGAGGKVPCSFTNTFARPPSSLVSTAGWMTCLPAFRLAHIGSIPMRMTTLPGDLPLRRTRPLIVPRPGVCPAARPSPPQTIDVRARTADTPRNTRRIMTTAREDSGLLFGSLGRGGGRRLVLERIPVLQVAVLARLIDLLPGV